MNHLCAIVVLCYTISLTSGVDISNNFVKCPEECECYIETGMLQADCSSNKLKELPVDLDTNVKHI